MEIPVLSPLHVAHWSRTRHQVTAAGKGGDMNPAGSPTVRRRQLAAELRRLRGNRKGTEVANALDWSTSKVSRAESGKESLPPGEIEKLVDFYGVTGRQRASLLKLAEDATHRGWWEDFADALTPEYLEFVGLEAEASSCSEWHSDVVPGLLQTEGYSRQLDNAYRAVDPATPPTAHERFLRVRQIRQERLTHEPVLPFSCVMDEAVLLRSVGDDAVMRAQLAYLAEVSALPNVDLRILPLKDNNGLGGVPSFTIFSFGPVDGVPDGTLGDALFLESLTTQHIEGDTNTHLFRLFFTALSKAALSPDDSRDLIVTTMARVRP